MGSSNENSAYGPVLNPWDRTRVPGRLLRRQRRGGGGRFGAVGAWHRHGRLDPPAGRPVWDRRHEANLWRGLALRDDRLRLLARPGGPADARRQRRRADAAPHGRPRRVRRHLLELPARDRVAERREPRGDPLGRARGADRRGHRSGCARLLRRRLAASRAVGRADRAGAPAARPARALGLLRDRPSRGLVEPGSFRRRALRLARRCRRLGGMYTRTRHDGFGAEVKRRIMLGTYALSSGYYDAFYGRAQRVRTKIVEDFRSVFERVDLIVTPTSPTVAFELGAKTGDPLSMYLNDFCTVPMSLAGIPAISIPCGLSDGSPGRLATRRPGLQRERAARCGVRAGASDRLRWTAARCDRCRHMSGPGGGYDPFLRASPRAWRNATLMTTSPTSPSSAWRSTSSWPPAQRCSAAATVLRRSPQHPHLPGLPRPARAALPVANARAIHFGLMIGMAVGSKLAPRSIFHRKNYFDPDLPKGYQISQYDEPLCLGGQLGGGAHPPSAPGGRCRQARPRRRERSHPRLRRVIVDFNRGGTPLAEIVTEPDCARPSRRGSGCACCARRCASSASRREHGGGLAALRRQHLAAPGGHERARHEDRAEEHELLPLHRTRHPCGDRPSGKDPERRRAGPAGDAPLRPDSRLASHRFAPRSRRTTIAISPSPTWCRWPSRSRCSTRRGRDARAAGREGGALRAELGLSAESARRLAFRAELGDYSRQGLAAGPDPAPAPQTLANWIVADLLARLEDGSGARPIRV